ncbi:MAG: HEAT repeat domain-containing protein [Chloroflexi bacterium]|nr:MAG: HEAT repeat domain-containing protein [Chloroflexota bacterium]
MTTPFDDDFDTSFDDFDADFDEFDDDLGLEDDDFDTALERDDDADLEELQRRHQERTSHYMKVLNNRKNPVKQRREAAYWLGESGEPEAIPILKKAARNDPDKSVREAAIYALRQFKALQLALQGSPEEQDRVMELLENVVRGKMGRRLPVPLQRMYMIMGGLFASFLVLLLIGLIIPSGSSAPPITDVADLPTLVPQAVDTRLMAQQTRDALNTMRTLLTDDLITIQRQIDAVNTGNALTCPLPLNNPQPYVLDTTVAELAAFAPIVEQLNGVQADLMTLQAPFVEACNSGTPPPAETITQLTETLLRAQRALPDIQVALDDPNLIPAATAAAPEATPEPTVPPPTDTPVPTPTLDPAVVRTDLAQLQFIIDDVQAQRGAYSILNRYWNDAAQAGQTLGCREPQPVVPDNYVINERVAELYPDIETAAENVNLGLDLLRQGWDMFAQSCANNTLIQDAQLGLTVVSTAGQAFSTANDLLINQQP